MDIHGQPSQNQAKLNPGKCHGFSSEWLKRRTYTYPNSYPLWGLLLNIMVFAKNLEENQYGSKVCPSSQFWAGSRGLAPGPRGSVPLGGCIMLIRARFTFRSSILADQVTCFPCTGECKSVWKYKRLQIETILCSHIHGNHFQAFFAFIAFGAGAAAAFIAFFAMVVSTWRTGENVAEFAIITLSHAIQWVMLSTQKHVNIPAIPLQQNAQCLYLNVGHSEGKPYGLFGPWERLPWEPGLLEIFVVVVVSPTLDLYSTHPPHFCEYVTPFRTLAFLKDVLGAQNRPGDHLFLHTGIPKGTPGAQDSLYNNHSWN